MSNVISEYDIVEVVAANPEVPAASVGDRGAVLMVHMSSGITKGFEIECVLPDGTNKWQGSFSSSQIQLVKQA